MNQNTLHHIKSQHYDSSKQSFKVLHYWNVRNRKHFYRSREKCLPYHWIKRVFSDLMHSDALNPSPCQHEVKKSYVSLPYYRWLSEKVSALLTSFNIQISFIPLRCEIFYANSSPAFRLNNRHTWFTEFYVQTATRYARQVVMYRLLL